MLNKPLKRTCKKCNIIFVVNETRVGKPRYCHSCRLLIANESARKRIVPKLLEPDGPDKWVKVEHTRANIVSAFVIFRTLDKAARSLGICRPYYRKKLDAVLGIEIVVPPAIRRAAAVNWLENNGIDLEIPQRVIK